MIKKKGLPDRKVLAGTGVFLLLMMVIGSVWDYSISQALYSPENLFGKFLAAFGEFPMGLVLAAAGAMLVCARNREKKLTGVLQIVLGAFLILSAVSTLAQITAIQASISIMITIPVSVVAVGLTVYGIFRLCEGADRDTVIKVAIIFVLFVFAEMIIVNVIKIPWGRARMRLVATDPRAHFMPWWQPGKELKNTLVAAGVASEEFKSFPSGHTANASSLMLLCLLPMICPKLENKSTLLFFIGFGWTCLVAVSRIIMGAHYLTDTTIGFAVGFIILIAAVQVLFSQKGKTVQAPK